MTIEDDSAAERRFDAADLLGLVGEQPFAPPTPRPVAFGVVVPTPRAHARRETFTVEAGCVSVLGAPADARGAVDLIRTGLFRHGVPVITEPGGYPIVVRRERVSGGEEGYRLSIDRQGATLVAHAVEGFARGAATFRQLVRRTGDGIEIVTGDIEDSPTVELRILGGWGLYRTHQLEEAFEVAVEGKFNRILYNWWAATPEESMGPAEEALVRTARSMCIEPIFDLRRQPLGYRFFDDEHATAALLGRYEEAAVRGFKCFGLLFDDTDVDTFEQEHGLILRIVDRLRTVLGEEPELYYCPRFYWLPGQMDHSWVAAALAASGAAQAAGLGTLTEMLGDPVARTRDAATARQERFLTQLGSSVPQEVNVYLGNWWSATPDDWSGQLSRGWGEHVGRPPVFWDNQQQNDYRAALGYPFALHQRPAEFAEALRGYYVNSGLPLATFAPASITAGAWAWNPHGYDPATAFGAAVGRIHGEAGPAATAAWATFGDVVSELMEPRTGLETHYAGLRRAVSDGTAATLRGGLSTIGTLVSRAEQQLSPRAHPLARRALAELRQDLDRISLDLELTELVVDAVTTPPRDRATAAATIEEAELLVRRIGEILANRLPPIQQVRDAQASGLDLSELDPAAVPGFSWLLHFYLVPESRTLSPLLGELRTAMQEVT